MYRSHRVIEARRRPALEYNAAFLHFNRPDVADLRDWRSRIRRVQQFHQKSKTALADSNIPVDHAKLHIRIVSPHRSKLLLGGVHSGGSGRLATSNRTVTQYGRPT